MFLEGNHGGQFAPAEGGQFDRRLQYGQSKTKGTNCGVKLIWPQLTSVCPDTGLSPEQKIQIRLLIIKKE